MNNAAERVTLLESWMKSKEGENQEFKEARNQYHFEDLVKYCCSLANEGGGRIILGVTNERPRKVVGTAAFSQPERTRKGLCERIPLAIDFEEIHHPQGRVLIFHVPSRPLGTAMKYEGIYWARKEDSLSALSEERLREIFAESGKDFSAEVCPDLRLYDLEPAAIEDFRRRWIDKATRAGNYSLVARLGTSTLEELLTDSEAVLDGKVTNAALILFGTAKVVSRHLAQAEVIFEYRSSDASGPPQEREEYRSGFFTFYDDLWKRINDRNEKQDFQEGFFVHPILTFGERPVREAILNAISHRDYQLGGSIFIRQYPRRLEIDSPGGLPVGITLDNILDRQNPRNRRIAEILMRCGLVERSGQGMNLIFEESIRYGKPVPGFSRTDKFQVSITLFGNVQDPQFVRFVEKVGKETTATFSTHDWLFLSRVARDMEIKRELLPRATRLEDLGLIERVRGRKFILSKRYYEFTGQKARYTRKRGLDREQNLNLLQNHIDNNAEKGSKLEELREVLPALTATHVQSLLRTLKKRGKTFSAGTTRAGRWFPGPGPKQSHDVNDDLK